ncbi:hypothetical protein IID22_03920 [Patescibacteria group bacterium]|nr:hypothetical protein [Patescibacteria group bacterium]
MRDFLKNKVVTVLIVVATIILAGVAIFTALRLYQLRTRPVAPTAPESQPAAGEQPKPEACRQLAFTISTPTPTPPSTGTPTPTTTDTPTPTSTSTPTPTEPSVGGPSSTPTPTTKDAPTSTPTPTTGEIAQASPGPTTAPTLPDAGTELPTIFAGAAGILLIIFSLLLAL